MMRFIPQSIFTWDFRVEGVHTGGATLSFNFFTEQGTIRYGSTEYTVRKHGPFSGEWTMDDPSGRPYARALKTNPFTRVFQVDDPGGTFLLKAVPMMRSFDIYENGGVVGNICPDHFLTRAATIDCGPALSEPGQLFCFWLAALMWRRAARDSHPAPAGS